MLKPTTISEYSVWLNEKFSRVHQTDKYLAPGGGYPTIDIATTKNGTSSAWLEVYFGQKVAEEFNITGRKTSMKLESDGIYGQLYIFDYDVGFHLVNQGGKTADEYEGVVDQCKCHFTFRRELADKLFQGNHWKPNNNNSIRGRTPWVQGMGPVIYKNFKGILVLFGLPLYPVKVQNR
jgi:hypothetical protein